MRYVSPLPPPSVPAASAPPLALLLLGLELWLARADAQPGGPCAQEVRAVAGSGADGSDAHAGGRGARGGCGAAAGQLPRDGAGWGGMGCQRAGRCTLQGAGTAHTHTRCEGLLGTTRAHVCMHASTLKGGRSICGAVHSMA